MGTILPHGSDGAEGGAACTVVTVVTNCAAAVGSIVQPGAVRSYAKRPHPVSGWFAKAVIDSGVPRLTPRDLRHIAASLAVAAGTNVKAAQKMRGDASAAMTLEIYADLFDDDLEAVAAALHDARLRENAAKMRPGGLVGWSKRLKELTKEVDDAIPTADELEIE